MASPPIWAGPATTAIDHVRFFYNEHFYHQAVREQAFGNDRGFVAFDWGSSGSAIGPARIHNLVYSENADFRMPMVPDNCQSTVAHLSGKFYSRRMLCG